MLGPPEPLDDHGSNTDLIKKGLRLAAWYCPSLVASSNTDLIKKGLRPVAITIFKS